jgi:hypothetical protein
LDEEKKSALRLAEGATALRKSKGVENQNKKKTKVKEV